VFLPLFPPRELSSQHPVAWDLVASMMNDDNHRIEDTSFPTPTSSSTTTATSSVAEDAGRPTRSPAFPWPWSPVVSSHGSQCPRTPQRPRAASGAERKRKLGRSARGSKSAAGNNDSKAAPAADAKVFGDGSCGSNANTPLQLLKRKCHLQTTPIWFSQPAAEESLARQLPVALPILPFNGVAADDDDLPVMPATACPTTEGNLQEKRQQLRQRNPTAGTNANEAVSATDSQTCRNSSHAWCRNLVLFLLPLAWTAGVYWDRAGAALVRHLVVAAWQCLTVSVDWTQLRQVSPAQQVVWWTPAASFSAASGLFDVGSGGNMTLSQWP
jgi:hypothetical protein